MGTRFSSRPCATCGVDTMHVGARCNSCGTMHQPQSFARAMQRVKETLTDAQGEDAATRKLFGLRKKRERARALIAIAAFGHARKFNERPKPTVFGRGSGRPSIK